jgi:N-acetylglutamate synthase-like GNAT family acetyltransferase
LDSFGGLLVEKREQMVIRPARAQDKATITAMVRRAHLNPMDLQWARFLIAEDAQGIVGAGQIRPHADASELASLVVRENRRGRGIGGQLVRALIAQAQGTLVLFCGSSMESYYRRFGFRTIGVQEAPPSLRVRYTIGRIVTQLTLGSPLLMMKKASEAWESSEV